MQADLTINIFTWHCARISSQILGNHTLLIACKRRFLGKQMKAPPGAVSFLGGKLDVSSAKRRKLSALKNKAYRGKTSGFDQISNKDAIILYCLTNGVDIDYARQIKEDIINKLNKKTREKVVAKPGFYIVARAQKVKDYELINEPVVLKVPKTSSKDEKNQRCFLFKGDTGSPTGRSKKKKQSSLDKDSNPSQPPASTHVVAGLDKEAQQATGGPTSLGVITSTIIHSESASEYVASTDSLVEADPGKSAPNDSISQQKDEKEVSFGDDEFNTSPEPSRSDDAKKEIKIEDLSKLWSLDVDNCDSVSSKDDNNDSDSSSEMSSTSRLMREVDVRGVDSDHVDSFEEGEIIGDSVLNNDGCVKDCMEKNLDDDVEKDIEDCSKNVTEKCGVVNNNMSNNVEGEILEDHFDGDRGNDTIEDNADLNPSTNVYLDVNQNTSIPEVVEDLSSLDRSSDKAERLAHHNNGLDDLDISLRNRLLHQDKCRVRSVKAAVNDSSIVSPSTPPGTDLNLAEESYSTWLDYVGPLITDELDSEKRWSYRDPDGNVQGSFSLAQLRMWKDYFPSDLKIWSYYGNVKETILLHSALKRRTKDAG
ncbi:zinc finger CCCH domain-containing protein 19 [Tanacetum coccineum]